MKAVYQPIGFLSGGRPPIECEVLEWIDEPGEIRRARIKYAVSEDSILGIASRSRGRTGPMPPVERIVLADCVSIIQ